MVMVLMMESQCEYFMYFPAVPISDLSDPAKYRTLPRRSHLYLGETVRFLLVLRSQSVASVSGSDGSGSDHHSSRSWRELAGSLCAVASVSPGDNRQRTQPLYHDYHSSGDECVEDTDDGDAAEVGCAGRGGPRYRGFRECKPLLIHNNPGNGVREFRKAPVQSPVDEPVVLSDEVIFPLTVSLDKLPVNTLKVKTPCLCMFEHLIVSVLNGSSQEEVCVRDVKILPNFNASYLPMMPDGSVLLVDNVCHQSGEVAMASFYRMDSESSHLPSMLSALEEQNFLFQLQLNNQPQDDSNEGLEVPLVAVLQWSTSKLPFTNSIYTHYSLPSVRLDRPRFIMTASCPSAVKAREHFRVRYTLLNNLQDFLAVRLVWTPEGRGQKEDPAVNAVVCHSPFSNLGYCRKGSTLSVSVAFQILRAGLFELSQHMKLKLQFTASVSNPPPDARPLSRKNSPSSPAVI
ncbi:uncharacterized protein C7orf43 homolog [Sinocyclocheilus anshuiensis]|uniref:uncharacterized protein C7orf43 homolog n=1 Tax=Sinocyclocheilus anshuiensis TaxID=1608454 RepID=UPI0007B88C69|nr:PREDICTED: uncharacterized protein C7orf43 homolog [Sinocyclocheilus anshuiensis]